MKNQKSKIKNQKWTGEIIKIFIIMFLYSQLITHNSQLTFAQSLSLSISPPLLELIIKPGKSIMQVYKITNNGDPVAVTASIQPLTSTGISDDPSFSPETWISLLNTDIAWKRAFFIPSQGRKELLVKIAPPQGAVEQDYYRALVLTTQPAVASDTTLSQVSQTLATPLLITITTTGEVKKEAAIMNFALPQFMDSFSYLTADIDVKNTGNTYFRPIGKINLNGMGGTATYDLNPLVIMSGATKRLKVTGSGQNENPHTLAVGGFYLGKYDMEVDFKLDEGNTRISSKKIFYAVPFKLIGTVLLLGAILLIVIIKRRERKKRP